MLFFLEEKVQIILCLPPIFVAYRDLQSSLEGLMERRLVFWVAGFISFVALYDFSLCQGMLLWITLFQVSANQDDIDAKKLVQCNVMYATICYIENMKRYVETS